MKNIVNEKCFYFCLFKNEIKHKQSRVFFIINNYIKTFSLEKKKMIIIKIITITTIIHERTEQLPLKQKFCFLFIAKTNQTDTKNNERQFTV